MQISLKRLLLKLFMRISGLGVTQRTKHVPVFRSYRKGSVAQGSGHCFANLCRMPHITIVAVRKFGNKSTVNCRNKIPRKSKPRYITGS